MEFLKIYEILLRKKHIFSSIFLGFFGIVVIGTHLITPSYKASAKVYIDETSNVLPSLLTNLGLKNISIREKNRSSSLSKEKLYQTDIELAKIRPLLKKLIFSLNIKDRRGNIMKPDKLIESSFAHKLKNKILPQSYLVVDQDEDADILEIISYSPNPSEATNMSNKLARLYIEYRTKYTRKKFMAARIFVEGQIQKVKGEYYNSLSTLSDFKIKEKTVNLEQETRNLLEKIENLKNDYEDNEKAILEAKRKIEKSEEKLKFVKNYRKESEQHSRSDSIKSLQTKLNDLLVSITQKSVDFTKEHPEYKQLEKQVEKVKELIKNEVEMVLDSETLSVDPRYDSLSQNVITAYIDCEIAIAKRNLLQEYLNEYQNNLLKIPVKDTENSKLELDLTVNKNIYQNLQEYLNQISIAERISLSNIKLIETAAVPYKVYFPKKGLNYVVGLFLGFFIALIGTFFIEYVDNTIKTPEDIKKITSLNLLGTIPRTRHLQKLNTISNLAPNSNIVEAYRTIKNSIKFACTDRQPKTLLITSSIDSEGKSSVAANISITHCMEEKKIILVDLNLRKPSIHRFFNIPNINGITNILSGDLPLDEVTIHTNIRGLDLVLAGPITTNPGRLIESQGLKDIISKLKSMYDMVIVDTPPIVAVNDALIVGTIADGVLYIIEAGKTTLPMIEHVKELVNKANLNLIGVVLNKLKVCRLN
jgi:capsular exopolysaccharide synthesis family protein